jgi:hypothetical protein
METININTFIGKQIYNACKSLKIKSFDKEFKSKNFKYTIPNDDNIYELYFINDNEFIIEKGIFI